jgi:hypothetical protein
MPIPNTDTSSSRINHRQKSRYSETNTDRSFVRVSTASRSPARSAEKKRGAARPVAANRAHVVHKSNDSGKSKDGGSGSGQHGARRRSSCRDSCETTASIYASGEARQASVLVRMANGDRWWCERGSFTGVIKSTLQCGGLRCPRHSWATSL